MLEYRADPPPPRHSNLLPRDGSFPAKKDHAESELFSLHLVEHNVRIQGLLRKLHASLIHQRAPDFYSYFFLGQLTLAAEEKIEDSVVRELQLLRTKKSHFHTISRTVSARQSCLKALSKCLATPFQSAAQAEAQRTRTELEHLRQLTALVIEQVRAWKQSLSEISVRVFADEHIAFHHHDSDYLIKILNDTDFVAESFLTSKVSFSTKQDPFLMRPTTQNNAEDNPFAQLFKLSSQEQGRYIQCLEILAAERAQYLRRKVALREEKIREIERVYNAKHMNNKIFLTKGPSALLKRTKPQTAEAPLDFIEESKVEFVSSQASSPVKSERRDARAMTLTLKGEKLRRLKEITKGSSPIIDAKKFSSLDEKPHFPVQRSVSLSFLKKTYKPMHERPRPLQQQVQTDFENLVRRKELLALESASVKRRTLNSVKLQDRLSQKQFVSGKQGAAQLQKIVAQLDHVAPQNEEGLLLARSSTRMNRTLLQQSEQALVGLRKQVLAEIGEQSEQRQQRKEEEQSERDKMDKFLRQKLLEEMEARRQGWVEGKQALADDLGKRALFDMGDPQPGKPKRMSEVEEQLKRQVQLKLLREVQQQLAHKTKTEAMQKQREKEAAVREKQLEAALRKEEREKRFLQIQNEERSKAIKQHLEDEERKQIEIEREMAEVVQKQEQKLIEFSVKQKVQLEEELREAAKSRLLQSLRGQKSQFGAQQRAQQQKRRQEEAHRQEVRQKVQKDYEIAHNLQRQREREERQRKLRLVGQKMDHLQKQVSIKSKNMDLEQQQRQRQIQQAKRSLESLPDPTRSEVVRQDTKKRMRQQFQLQLFAYNRPEQFKSQQDEFVVNDYRGKIDNEEQLDKKIEEIQGPKEPQEQALQVKRQESIKQSTIIMPKHSSLLAQQPQPSEGNSNAFVRFSDAAKSVKNSEPDITASQLRAMGLDMTPDQYAIYLKKKMVIDAKRINPIVLTPQQQLTKLIAVLGDFQKMEDLSPKQPKAKPKEEFVLQPVDMDSDPQPQSSKKKEERQHQIPSPKHHAQREDKKERDLSEVMKLTVHSKMTPKMMKKKFVTSDEEQDSQDESPRRRRKAINKSPIRMQPLRKEKSEDSEDKPKRAPKQQKKISSASEQEVVQNRNMTQQKTQMVTVKQKDLDHYLTAHFKQLSKLMRKLNLFKKDELLKTILQTKHVMIIEVTKGEERKGMVFAVQNENKPAIRSLNLLHVGAYAHQDTLAVLLGARDKLFLKDPCVEIAFSHYFDKGDQQQNDFIKQFQGQFDPYGAIFQKNISNTQTQRKYVLRRMVGQESKVSVKVKNKGEISLKQQLFAHSVEDDLGVELGLKDTGKSVGGWTLLALFLAKEGKSQAIDDEVASEIQEERKNIRHLARMTQKLRDCRVRDFEITSFATPLQANLKLVEVGEEAVTCDPDVLESKIKIHWVDYPLQAQPRLPFLTCRSPFTYQNQLHSAEYLRYQLGKASKVFKLISSLYSTVMTVVPCKPSHLKLLIMDSHEYDSISDRISLDLYLKLFLANVASHDQVQEQHLWLPQIATQHRQALEYADSFGFNSESVLKTSLKMAYTEYVPNSLKCIPTHRDIVVSPPYIVGIISSEVEKSVEGSPVYAQRIDLPSLQGVQHTPAVVESDF